MGLCGVMHTPLLTYHIDMYWKRKVARVKDEDIKKLSLPKKDFISALKKVGTPVKSYPKPSKT